MTWSIVKKLGVAWLVAGMLLVGTGSAVQGAGKPSPSNSSAGKSAGKSRLSKGAKNRPFRTKENDAAHGGDLRWHDGTQQWYYWSSANQRYLPLK